MLGLLSPHPHLAQLIFLLLLLGIRLHTIVHVVNTCFGRYRPTWFSVCPRLLLSHSVKCGNGSCRLCNLNGHFVSLGDKIIVGIVTHEPRFLPEMMLALTNQIPRCVMINLVPLQRPYVWFQFLRSIIGIPTVNCMSWFGIPGKRWLFKNSVGYNISSSLVFTLALHTVFEI